MVIFKIFKKIDLIIMAPHYIFFPKNTVKVSHHLLQRGRYGMFLLNVGQNLNTLMPGQNGRHLADDIFKCIFLNENVWIQIQISLKFVHDSPINNIPALI